MAVKIVKHPSDVAVGKFVNAGREGVNGHVTGPRQITQIKGTRLYYVPEDSKKESYFLVASAVYVCDSREESEKIFDVVYRRGQDAHNAATAAAEKARKAVHDQYQPELGSLVA